MAGENDIEIKIKAAIDEAASAKTLGEFKKTIRELKSLALQAEEGSSAFNDVTSAIGDTNHRLKELNETIATKSSNGIKNFVNAAKGIGSVGLAGFETLTGAAAAFGDQSDELMQKMVKLQGLMIFTKGISELSEASDNLSRGFNVIADSAKSMYNTLNSGIINFGKYLSTISFQGIINGLAAFGTAVVTFVTETALPAFVGFFTTIETMAATNPLGLILIAIGLIIGALVLLVDNFKPVKMLFEGIKAVVMGVIQALKDFSDWLGITTFAQEEAAKKALDLLDKEKKAIDDRYNKEIKLAEAAGKLTSWLEMKKTLELKINTEKRIAEYEKLKASGVALTKEQEKDLEDQRQNLQNFNTDIEAMRIKGEEEVRKLREDSQRKQTTLMKEGFDKNKAMRDQELADVEDNLSKQKALLEEKFKADTNGYQATGDIMIAFSKKQSEDTAILEKTAAAEKDKINRDYNKANIELGKDNLNKRKDLIDKEYDYRIQKAEFDLQETEYYNKKKLNAAAATLEADLRANNLSEEAKNKYFNAVKVLTDDELAKDKLVYDVKIEQINKLQSLYKVGSDDYKKYELEKSKLAIDLDKSSTGIKMNSINAEKKALDDSLQRFIVEHGNTIENLYKIDQIKAQENYEYQKKIIEATVTDEKQKATELANLYTGYSEEKKRIDEEYQKKHSEILDKIESDFTDEKAKEMATADAAAHEKLKSAEEAYKLEIAMGGDVVKAGQTYADRRAVIEQELADKMFKINEDYSLRKKSLVDQMLNEEQQMNLNAAKAIATGLNQVMSEVGSYMAQQFEQQQSEFDKAQADKLASLQATNAQAEQDFSDNQAIELANFTGTNEEKAAMQKQWAQDKVKRDNEAKMAEYQIALEKYNFDLAIKKKAFEQNKKMQLASAIISAALAVVNGLATAPFIPLGVIAAATAAITGAISIAKIASTKFEDSGSPPQKPVLASAAAAGLSFGGGANNTGQGGPQAPAFFRLGQGGPNTQTDQSGKSQRVYVLESDITGTQNRVSVIESRASQTL